MEIIFDREKFNSDISAFIDKIEDSNKDLTKDLEDYRLKINRWYNQLRDHYENPLLAEKNSHHDKEELAFCIIHILLILNSKLSNDFEFSGRDYILKWPEES